MSCHLYRSERIRKVALAPPLGPGESFRGAGPVKSSRIFSSIFTGSYPRIAANASFDIQQLPVSADNRKPKARLIYSLAPIHITAGPNASDSVRLPAEESAAGNACVSMTACASEPDRRPEMAGH